jgi:phosphatidylethanolamine-binding protein (PEBP) family uncharacterized protein
MHRLSRMVPLFALAIAVISLMGFAAPRFQVTMLGPSSRTIPQGSYLGLAYSDYSPDEPVTPGFTWSRVPAGTASIAIVITDANFRNAVHAILYDLPPNRRLAYNEIRDDTIGVSEPRYSFGRNDFVAAFPEYPIYMPPLPPPGSRHRYVVTAYALKISIGIDGLNMAQFRTAIRGKVLAKSTTFAYFLLPD